MNIVNKLVLPLLFFALPFKPSPAAAQNTRTALKDFPAASSPALIGKKIAERFVSMPYANFGQNKPPKVITYPEVCTWYGSLTFAKLAKDKSLTEQLVKRFEPLLGSRDTLQPPPNHVDNTVFGTVPLELFIQTKDQRYLQLGLHYADEQWNAGSAGNASDEALLYIKKGLSWQTRLWIDDMFMITSVQAQAYRATKNDIYIDRTAKEMVFYLDSLQQPNGLFHHASDAPVFWGRGNGWMAAGMSELLRSLPKNNIYRSRIMKGYQRMMATLLKYQDLDGMWHQIIDDPTAWKETSCTGMFAFAFITGVKEGWLDEKTYAPAARKAWINLVKYIDSDGDITEVCEGTNKKNDRQFYLNRKRVTGDLHGQAPLLWCATALLR